MRSAGTVMLMRRSRAEVFSTETCMDIPRCTDVGRAFPTPESRACILVGQTQEVTLLKTRWKQAPDLGRDKRSCPTRIANTVDSAQGSAPTLLYIEAAGPVAQRPAPQGDRRTCRASSRNTFARTRPQRAPKKTAPMPNTEPPKTKTAQPFSGTAPFSAI
ncbi:hypothetical protein D9M68_781010 [compost metagenome]